MCVLTTKSRAERQAFVRFIGRMNQQHAWLSVCSRPDPEPDLLCMSSTDGLIAFEVVSLTDPKVAQLQAAGPRAHSGAFSTSDPSASIIWKKLHRSYKTDAPQIDLLIYTDGQIITPDDEIIPTIGPLFDAINHPFKQAWSMGENETRRLWHDS